MLVKINILKLIYSIIIICSIKFDNVHMSVHHEITIKFSTVGSQSGFCNDSVSPSEVSTDQSSSLWNT